MISVKTGAKKRTEIGKKREVCQEFKSLMVI